MLHERWREVAAARGSARALTEASGQPWTFAALARAAAESPARPVQFPGQAGPDGADPGLAAFVIRVLAAWRDRVPCCPLEPGPGAGPDLPPPGGVAHLKRTSATSGPARWVAFTEAQLAADADQIVATMGLRPDWPNLGVLSKAHSYGFSNLVLPLLLHGIPLVELASPLPDALRRAAAGRAACTLAAVPALWRAWHEAGAIPPGVRLAISAGAPLPVALEQAVHAQAGLKIHNFYGATECGGIAYDATEEPRADASLAGTPLRGVEVTVDPAGCLEIRSPAAGLGYWPESAPGLSGGVYRSADLAELRAGAVHLRGRAGDVIHVAGRKVSPADIEQALLAHPAVADCLVLGLPAAAEGRGEEIVACVVPRAGPGAAGPLRDFLMARLPAWQVPRRWHFVDTLAPNARGKLSRADWRRRLGGAG
ncbi:MAG: hypothetical protein RJA22_546 [Verrucomicrobiota bacterium]|jgi:acyl-coenzyme A synthetase/AMP-(fatty) acid ligase